MLAILLPCGGGPEVPILAPKVVLGRHSDCDVPLAYRSVSGRHCELERVEGWWRVRDLGSSNGTRINGNPIGVSWLLPDDVLTVGKERFYLVYVAPEDKPRPPRETGLAFGRKPAAPPSRAVRHALLRAWTLGELVPSGGGETIPLLKPVVVIGRTTGCDFIIDSGDVSSRHCQLEFTEGHWFVHDLGSRNGTRVDNQRCDTVTPVLPGCVLAVARHRFRVVYAPDAVPASDEDPFARRLLEKAGLEDWDPEEEEPGPE
jgi:pSer/pThr/pTyr-binding forkhead associated (FHA) protein